MGEEREGKKSLTVTYTMNKNELKMYTCERLCNIIVLSEMMKQFFLKLIPSESE